MIAAVLDTNTVVSANLVEQGISNQLLLAARSGRFRLVTSAVIISEVIRTLSKDRIQRKYSITAADIDRVRILLEQEAVVTPITVRIEGIATHPEDDLILATAVSAGADYLVTGDRQLRNLGTFRGVTIVSPREFQDILLATAGQE